ncbi:scavenger receptor cysteine-rich domain-containing protein DMBT1-like isoform 2-T2 [Polymixia lowei]
MQEAEVVCREMNCGTPLAVEHGAYYGQGDDQVWMDDVECTGHEKFLTDCPHRGFGENDCSHSEDAGVVCSDHARLVNGTSRCSGRVEVNHNGHWRKVCNNDWGKKEAEVLCREVGCGAPLISHESPYFGQGSEVTGVNTSCFGNESSPTQCTLQEFNQTCGDASVVCTNSKPLRLVNGTNRCSGRVEVYHGGQWGTVCDDGWGMQEAEVVCREMNCGTPVAVKHRAYYGQGDDQVWMDNVKCTGHEKFLTNCPHRDFGEHDCDHSEDASVICSDHARLVNGTNQCSGRVEVNHNGHWRKVCNSDWGKKEAEVLCRDVGCGAPLISHESPYFSQGSEVTGVKTSCFGNESSLTQCTLQEFNQTCGDASVVCTNSKPLRLVNGTNRCSGRVEVYHGGQWGTVCDDGWGMQEAEVVCREMNCGTPVAVKHGAYYGRGDNDVWMDDVECTGHEKFLTNCPHRSIGDHDCGHSEDAGVICSDHVRLVNGTNRCSGRVEVNHNGHWRKVCNSDWGKKEGEVLCREVGCGAPVFSHESPYFGQGSEVTGVKTSCFGNESSLSQCTLQEFNQGCGDTSVVCTNSKLLRLVNGTNRCSGRVEVYHDGQWGTVCDDRWGMQEAEVACREMNCGTPLAIKYRAYYGQGDDQVWMDDVECTGHEKSLTDCPHRGFGENDCSHSEDAGVVCSEAVRLINGTNRCSGRVEVYYQGQWGKMCSSDWGTKKAAMVCKELNCGMPDNSPVKPQFGEGKGLRGYTSNCRGNESSITQCSLHINPARCEDVALSCTGHPTLRLVNGTDKCSGRVEIQHDGQWGTVCDDQWDIRDAQVVCREMNCGTVQTAKSAAYFGQGHGEIWLDDTECFGNESSLSHCQHASFGENNCGHSEDAGVVCSNTIRLINGTDHCSGRVEVYHGGLWSPVYNVNWGLNEAEVVCREMDCGDPVMASGSSQFGQGSRLGGYTIRCGSKESSLTQCSLREFVRTSHDHAGEATVVCSGNVRLVNGSSQCAGRVEFYHNGQWGTVCGDSWDTNDATVVCRQLNCGRAHKINHMSYFGHGSGKIWIDEIECNGRESSLTQCTQREFGDNTCNHTSVAGVICSDSLAVRLVNSNDQCSGRVELYHAGQWGTMCDRDWTMNDAEVVCKLLDCGHAVSAPISAPFGQGTGPIWEASNSCFGSETSLQQCSVNGFNNTSCRHEEDAGIVCAEQIKLVNGKSECSGRVEIYHKSQWGTVCDDEWEMTNAEVVCRQLGCGQALSYLTNAHFGRGSGPIWLDNVECTGQENALTQCSHNDFGDNNCGHGEDAGVVCLGILPKPQITLSPAPEVNWGDRVEITCTMVTEHLGGTFVLQKTPGSFKMEKYSDNDAITFTIPKVDLSHKGWYHCEYRKRLAIQDISFPKGDSAELSVTVRLEQPSISLTSPHAMVIFSPDKIEVTRGSSFSITCSIHSQYPGGFFYLTMSNVNVTEPKPAFGHSIFLLAYFDFPVVGDKDQGEYSCVYGVNISTLSFSSPPSKSLQVIVMASSSSSVISGTLVGLLLLLLLLVSYLVWRRRGQTVRAMVRFSNRVGETIKQDTEDKVDGPLDGRDYNSLVNENGNGRTLEDKGAEVDSHNSAERTDTEDLTGRVCYELEPLIHP